jgi:hypothetical protein
LIGALELILRVPTLFYTLFRYQFHLFYRNLRDWRNPFELPHKQFVEVFRLNKEAVQFVLAEVVMHLAPGVRRTAIPNSLKGRYIFSLMVVTRLMWEQTLFWE